MERLLPGSVVDASLDLRRVHRAATDGPADLPQFLGRLKNHAP